MSLHQRLLDTISGRPVSPPVWTADISYWITGNERADLADETGYLEFCRALGCMPYYWYDAFWASDRRYPEGCVATETEGDRSTTTWRCGDRTLVGVDRFSTTSWSRATIKYPVENAEDLSLLIELLERSPLAPSAALAEYRDRRAAWEAYEGLPSIGLPRSPVSAFINEWAGVEHGLILLFEQPELCAALFSLLEEQEQPILSACVEREIALVHIPDNLTSEIYTSIFDDYMRETYIRRLEVLHRGGIPAAVHLDGTVAGMLPKLAETGIDAVEAVTPLPVGDCSVEAMRDMVSDRPTILWGGIPGAMFAPPYTWEDMRTHLEHVLEAWAGTRFVLGVADQVPPDGDIETVRRIAEYLESS